MTETKGALAAALAQAQARARSVEKDAKNTFHKYAYASAEAILGEAKHALEGTGLALVPQNDAVAASPAVEGQTVSWVLTRGLLLVHSSGESIYLTTSWPIVPDKGRPLDKAVASARTTSLAYLLRDLLLMPRVAEGEDMDHGSRDERRDDRREEAPRGPAGRRREPAREEVPAPSPSRAAKAPADPTPPSEAPPAGMDTPTLFRAAERATLALVLSRLQDALVAQQLLDAKRSPDEVDAPLTNALSKAALAQGYLAEEIHSAWARVGKAPKQGASIVQARAFVTLLPDKRPAA